jgi:S-adenosylmethionine decarboxylase
MSFEYKGLHLMIDAVVSDPMKLVDPNLGVKMVEDIVEKIDMTMILPPVTVKFPHAICEMTRVLEGLEAEGLKDSKTANDLRNKLSERKNESYGYSTFAMIAESHLSIHTFPELGYFSFDCYSCKYFDTDAVLSVIKGTFSIQSIDVQKCDRRIPGACRI